MTWEDILNSVEPALSYIYLRRKNPDELSQVFTALDSCERFLQIYLPPQVKTFQLVELRNLLQEQADARCYLADWDDATCRGDPCQIAELLGCVLNGARLEKDAIIQVSAVVKNDIPRIVLSFDGPGCFPECLALGAAVYLGFHDFEERWTAATRGGGITKTPYRLELRLAGQKPLPHSFPQAEKIVGYIEDARQILKEKCTDPSGDSKKLEGILQNCVDLVQPKDCSLTALDVIATAKKAFEEIRQARVFSKGLCELRSLTSIPPLLVPRGLFHLFWKNAARLVAENAIESDTVVFVNYNAENRLVNIRFCFVAFEASFSVECLLVSLERLVADMEGQLATKWNGKQLENTEIDLKDVIGMRLDSKLPGWEHFTAKSKQLLRMLESLPEDQSREAIRGPVLQGVLEEELEKNLLPALSLPQIVNYAYDLSGIETPFWMAQENLEKVLSQVRRGKPKKELARRAYAAAAYWLFSKCPAFRERTGLQELSTDDIRAFCQILMEPVLDNYQALRYLARMRSFAREGSNNRSCK